MLQHNHKIIGIIGIITVIIIVIIGLLLLGPQSNKSSSDNTEVTVTFNYSNLDNYYPNLPTETTQSISRVINDMFTVNPPNTALSTYTANVSPDHPHLLQYHHSNQAYYGEFIIDLPEAQQSYLITLNYSFNPDVTLANPVDISCPTPDHQIYTDFKCNELGQH